MKLSFGDFAGFQPVDRLICFVALQCYESQPLLFFRTPHPPEGRKRRKQHLINNRCSHLNALSATPSASQDLFRGPRGGHEDPGSADGVLRLANFVQKRDRLLLGTPDRFPGMGRVVAITKFLAVLAKRKARE